jgi:rubredoxin
MKQIFILIILLVIGYAVYEVLQGPLVEPEPEYLPEKQEQVETEPEPEQEQPAPVPSITPLDQLKKTNRCPDCNLEKADLVQI